MAKNIVICCDGTGNQLNETYSNVVKLNMSLDKNPVNQLVFYDPGVGTMSDPNVVNPLSKSLSKYGGLAFGWGLKLNVSQAYGYLMEYFEPGDRIFIFGFSRGAYTARVLAAIIHSTGLLQKGCQHLIPYAWQIFKKSFQQKQKPIAQQFKDTYSRDIGIHFVGCWDTVSSIGLFNRLKLPFTSNNPSIQHIRHAMAIDECRTYYRQNLFGTRFPQNIKQVWFAGVHSDVGGSYPLDESGLSQITLAWMIREASAFGLIIDPVKQNQILNNNPPKGYSIPDVNEPIHKSLKGFWWWLLEFLPKRKRKGFPHYYLPFGSERKLYEDSMGNPLIPTVHSSVIQKIATTTYLPLNFGPKSSHAVEP